MIVLQVLGACALVLLMLVLVPICLALGWALFDRLTPTLDRLRGRKDTES